MLIPPASAYELYGPLCNGKPPGGIHHNVAFKIDRCHTPAGSQEEDVLIYGMRAWTSIFGAQDRLAATGGDNNCALSDNPSAGTFEAAFVPHGSAILDGNAGMAYVIYSGVCESQNREATSATVALDQNYSLSPLNELDISFGGCELAIHEFGHVLGLDHEDDEQSVMYSGAGTSGKVGRRGVTGGLGARAETQFPDDTDFMVTYHASSNVGRPDAVVSPWFRKDGVPARTHITGLGTDVSLSKCPGSTAEVRFSFGNIGKVDIVAGDILQALVVLSSDTTISIDDNWVLSLLVTADSGFFDDAKFTFSVPFLPAGTYHVGVIIDAANSLAEDDDYNNSTLTGLRIVVPSGC